MKQGWYLARTKPLSEYVAASALRRYGYGLYFPRVKTPRPRRGYDDAPMFPGYLFVRHEQDGLALPPVARIAGLIGWVQFDSVVPRVPDEVITELGLRLNEINTTGGYWTRFKPGEKVRVYTNQVHGEWGGFSFGRGSAIWANADPDIAGLYDATGNLVSTMSYPPGCP